MSRSTVSTWSATRRSSNADCPTSRTPHGATPHPSIVVADPRPDWFFIGYFTILALMPKGAEAVLIIGIPAIITAFLFLLPFARPFGQRHPLRRPLALTAAVVFIGGYTAL